MSWIFSCCDWFAVQVVTNNAKCHSKTSEMKSTRSELKKTSNIIEKVQLSTKLSQFEKTYILFNPKSYMYNFVLT